MNRKMTGTICKTYFLSRSKYIVFYIFSIAVLFALGGLYSYTQMLVNMLYGVGLIAFFCFLFGIYDFYRYYRKCRELQQVIQREEHEIFLPKGKDYQEQLYQELVRIEEQEKREIISEYDRQKRDLEDYYTMWTHQIKTPIAAMKLLLLDREEVRAEQEELFKIERYVEMALHFARLQSISSDFELCTVEVRAVISQALKKYALLFSRSGLAFEMKDFYCYTISDDKWLSFVFEQLLSNALKYTPKGKIMIYGLNAERKLTEGAAVFVVVEDTGYGIPYEDQPRIFERGFTGFNGRMDKKSTGIGLYLCQQILKKLSHTIEVESEPGKGTRMIVSFPDKAER